MVIRGEVGGEWVKWVGGGWVKWVGGMGEIADGDKGVHM